jgi:hypothetical protein
MYLPFKPTKGEEFTLYMTTRIDSYQFAFLNPGAGTYAVAISKDGGAFAAATNTRELIGAGGASGQIKIVLTAAEMNADNIMVCVAGSDNNSEAQWCNIYTQAGSSSSAGISLTDTVTDVEAITETSPTINEVLSLLHTALVKCGNREGWSFKKWLNRFNF